jgi:hypothetical protein
MTPEQVKRELINKLIVEGCDALGIRGQNAGRREYAICNNMATCC